MNKAVIAGLVIFYMSEARAETPLRPDVVIEGQLQLIVTKRPSRTANLGSFSSC